MREQLMELIKLKPTDDQLDADVVMPESRVELRKSVDMPFPVTAKPPPTEEPLPIGPQEPLPREVAENFLLWDMWDDPELVRGAYFKFMGKVARNERTDTFILHSEGVRWGKVVHRTKAKQWAVGKKFIVDDQFRCTLADTADRVMSAFQRQDGSWTDRSTELLALVGGTWDDKEILYFLKYGMRFSADAEWALLISPLLKSGRDNLARLREKLDEQSDDAKRRDFIERPHISANITGMPAMYHSSGWAWKKFAGKGRGTLNCSNHDVEGMVGPSGRSFGLNESTPELGRIEWVKSVHHRQAHGVLFLLMGETIKAHPDCAPHVRVTQASEDCRAFFPQFFMALFYAHMQGTCLPEELSGRTAGATSTASTVRVYTSPVLLFGGKQGPDLAQRVAFAQTAAALNGQWDWEMIVHSLAVMADSGVYDSTPFSAWASNGELASAARLIAPKYVRDWVERRLARLGDRFQAMPSWIAQYIDDSNGHHLGRVRALKQLLVVWRICKVVNLPKADGKAQFGELTNLLGVACYGPQGINAVTELRCRILKLWKARLDELRRWERAEANSLIGTLAFCVITAIKAKKLLRPCYRYLHMKGAWKVKKGALWGRIPKYVRQGLEMVIEAVLSSKGSPVLDPFKYEEPLEGVPQYYTDANRKRTKGFSGIAGVLMLNGEMYWFNMQLSKTMVDIVPVHVTELLAEVILLFLFGPLLQGMFVQGYIDNMASLWAILSESSADPRFQILLILRADLLEYYDIEVSSSFVRSKDNTTADPASRNDIKRFRQEAKRLGFEEPKRFDARLNGPSDLDDLMQALITATLNMKSSTRSSDFNP